MIFYSGYQRVPRVGYFCQGAHASYSKMTSGSKACNCEGAFDCFRAKDQPPIFQKLEQKMAVTTISDFDIPLLDYETIISAVSELSDGNVNVTVDDLKKIQVGCASKKILLFQSQHSIQNLGPPKVGLGRLFSNQCLPAMNICSAFSLKAALHIRANAKSSMNDEKWKQEFRRIKGPGWRRTNC